MNRLIRRSGLRTALAALVVLVLLALAAWINAPLVARLFDGGADRVAALPASSPFIRGQRVLLLSPHPDDETLCCAGIIQQAQAAGAQVFVAWMTAGDGFEFDAVLTQRVADPSPLDMQALGNARAAEARRAVALLGVPPARTFMLGYPDGGLFQLFTTHYQDPYLAPHTGTAAVYVNGALTPNAPFTGQAWEADLNRVLARVQPHLVLAPAPQDFHSDHRTLSYVALRLMAARQQEDRLRFWVVHGGLEWPLPKGLHPELSLTVPPLASTLPWTRVTLSAAHRQRKLDAVNAYHTQTRVMGRFMRAFVRQNELLSPAPLP